MYNEQQAIELPDFCLDSARKMMIRGQGLKIRFSSPNRRLALEACVACP